MRKSITGVTVLILFMQCCFFLFAEESFFESKLGKKIEVEGKALNTMMGAIVQTEYGDIYITDLDCWPDDIYGSLIRIKGSVVKKYDLPVFIQEEGASQKTGIPVPPGTDLKEARRRYLLDNADWIVISSSRIDH